jgi:hypothetical protein
MCLSFNRKLQHFKISMRFARLFGTFMTIAPTSLLTNYFNLGPLTKQDQFKPDVSNGTENTSGFVRTPVRRYLTHRSTISITNHRCTDRLVQWYYSGLIILRSGFRFPGTILFFTFPLFRLFTTKIYTVMYAVIWKEPIHIKVRASQPCIQ